MITSFISARQHRPLQSTLYAISRWSVRLPVCRVDHSKRLKVGLCNFHRTVSPIPLVFAGWVSSRNSNGFLLSGRVKQGRVGKTSHFFLALCANSSKTVQDNPPFMMKGSCDLSTRNQRHPSVFLSALQLCTWTFLCYALSTAGTSTLHSHCSLAKVGRSLQLV